MSEIIDLEPIRLSRMEEQELVVVAIEKAARLLLDNTALIKELSEKVAKLEENVKEREDEIDDIFRILDAT